MFLYRPNCFADCRDGVLRLKTLKAIDSGEQITIAYQPVDAAFMDRRIALQETYLFDVAPGVCSIPTLADAGHHMLCLVQHLMQHQVPSLAQTTSGLRRADATTDQSAHTGDAPRKCMVTLPPISRCVAGPTGVMPRGPSSL